MIIVGKLYKCAPYEKLVIFTPSKGWWVYNSSTIIMIIEGAQSSFGAYYRVLLPDGSIGELYVDCNLPKLEQIY
jgi:hypothetical protein